MYNKRAQSEIITTVLIILLVLAAVVIVWQVVKTTVAGGTGQISSQTDCMAIGLNIAKINNLTNNITITRAAGGGEKAMSNVKILIDGAAVTATIQSSYHSNLTALETGIWNVDSSVAITPTSKIEVAPVLSDTSKTVCNVAATVTCPNPVCTS